MAPVQKHPPGPPMTLGNMGEQGVRGLAVYCLNHACRHSIRSLSESLRTSKAPLLELHRTMPMGF
jgi:hypothetical protein